MMDAEILQKFEGDYENYCRGDYSGWQNDPDGRLAIILLLDQYTRNMFRGSAKAFETDPDAQRISLKMISDEKVWNEYKAFEKYFLLLPLMHAENKT